MSENFVIHTRPPAKLNLFLEIPAKLDDGYHEIDTVMAAIDLCDELQVQRTDDPTVSLQANWLPSRNEIARELGLPTTESPSLADPEDALFIPTDERNLVVKALQAFRQHFGIASGFHARLGKRIPAGAGMGGASSDAAHAISCAAQLHQVTHHHQELHQIAASIGSDVPFFLPMSCENGQQACMGWATGRGEKVAPLAISSDFDPSETYLLIAYPPIPLSTAKVYSALRIPKYPVSSAKFRQALQSNNREQWESSMMNRLSEVAEEITPQVKDLLKSLWKSGLETCQLTGSGSACFGVASNFENASRILNALQSDLTPGVLLRLARITPTAAPIRTERS